MKCFISRFCIFLGALASFCSCSKSDQMSLIDSANASLWKSLDSTSIYLQRVDSSLLSKSEKRQWLLLNLYVKMQNDQGLDSVNNGVIEDLQDQFVRARDFQNAGFSAYTLGRNSLYQNNLPMAIYHLKNAEDYYRQTNATTAMQWGVLNSVLGYVYEEQRLCEIAQSYHRQALPYFVEAQDSLMIACTYRDIIKNEDITGNSPFSYIDSAINYCPSDQVVIRMDCELLKFQKIYPQDTSLILDNLRTLCDEYGYLYNAADLCEHYRKHLQWDSVEYYLAKLALDTANYVWSREQFFLQKAQYLYAIGEKNEAMGMMLYLHNRQTNEIALSSFDRAYMVEQRFEAEREKQARVEETARKARAYMGLATLSISVVALLAIGGMIWKRKKEQLSLAEERNAMLERELQFKYHQLKHQLRLRIDVSTNLQKELLGNQKLSGKGMLKVIEPMIYINEDQWELLYHDFDEMVSGKLSLLQQNYPALSTMDIRQIILITLDCTTENISLLLNIGNRAVWNRTYRIKEHLNIPVADLKPWLAEYFHLHLSE